MTTTRDFRVPPLFSFLPPPLPSGIALSKATLWFRCRTLAEVLFAPPLITGDEGFLPCPSTAADGLRPEVLTCTDDFRCLMTVDASDGFRHPGEAGDCRAGPSIVGRGCRARYHMGGKVENAHVCYGRVESIRNANIFKEELGTCDTRA